MSYIKRVFDGCFLFCFPLLLKGRRKESFSGFLEPQPKSLLTFFLFEFVSFVVLLALMINQEEMGSKCNPKDLGKGIIS